MQEKLTNLQEQNDPFWTELIQVSTHHQQPVTGPIVIEDLAVEIDANDQMDDSDVSLQDVIAVTHKNIPPKRQCRIVAREAGGLMTTTNVESLDEVPKLEEKMAVDSAGGLGMKEGGKGKWKRMENSHYRLEDFARHWDNDGSDIE